MKHSQNDEESVILRLLSDVPPPSGRLLDIGAFLPSLFSNSRALLDLGWSGVLVEPSPDPFNNLLKHYRDNQRVTLVNCAIAKTAELARFWDSGGDALSSASEDHLKKWEPR